MKKKRRRIKNPYTFWREEKVGKAWRMLRVHKIRTKFIYSANDPGVN